MSYHEIRVDDCGDGGGNYSCGLYKRKDRKSIFRYLFLHLRLFLKKKDLQLNDYWLTAISKLHISINELWSHLHWLNLPLSLVSMTNYTTLFFLLWKPLPGIQKPSPLFREAQRGKFLSHALLLITSTSVGSGMQHVQPWGTARLPINNLWETIRLSAELREEEEGHDCGENQCKQIHM